MDLLESYYGKQTFILYSLFAKVPGWKDWPRQVFVTSSVLLLSLVTVYQAIKLFVERFSEEVIIEILPTITISIGTLIYIAYIAYASERDYEAMLAIILNDLRVESTEEEDEIRMRYAKAARIFMNALTGVFGLGMVLVPLLGFLPNLLDMVMPLNETRERQLFVNGEIFIDQQKYFLHVYFFENCCICVVCIIIGVSENMSVIIGQHICGMIEILGYRLKNITRIEEHKLLDTDDYNNLVMNKLKACISKHHTVIEFGELITSFYDIPLTLMLIGSFTSLTVSLVQITDLELVNMMMIFFSVGQVIQLFLLSYMGQIVMDASKRLSVYAYNAPWYLCPPKAQKFLQLMILRSSHPYMIVACSMYTLTLANFMSVMQTVTSFYMVLRHTR